MLTDERLTGSAAPTSGNGVSPRLDRLVAGMPLLYDGNRLAYVDAALAAAFQPGDRLVVLQRTGSVLHIPRREADIAAQAVAAATSAFDDLRRLPDDRIDRFYDLLGARLEEPETWDRITAANATDVQRAQARGRSTTRLVATPTMRRRMLDGVAQWRALPSGRGRVVDTIEHSGWSVEQVRDGLGVVGFVFEGRPNVLVDATGILRTGNTAALRIGRDALATARELVATALRPALEAAGLPADAVVLLESEAHAAGWALFSQPGLALAVARGSGPAVAQLGDVARQAGIPVSLHGTGGAWLVADRSADPSFLRAVTYHSLDRKVCNTLNTACIERGAAAHLLPVVIEALAARGAALGHGYRLHATDRARPFVPPQLFTMSTQVLRAQGLVGEPIADEIDDTAMGREWEWEATPEVSIAVVESVDEAVQLLHAHSPHFVASLVSGDAAAHDRFFRTVDAPFVGNGFTRWVDGQFALNRPELGLTNWQNGRLFGRGGILTGDGVYTLRLRVRQHDPGVHQ